MGNNIKTVYKNLLKTENNMCIVLEKMGDKTISADELALVVGWSGFTTRKNLDLLFEAGCVDRFAGRNAKGSHSAMYKATGKPYIPRTLEEISETYVIKSNEVGYGVGEWWTPWLPKVPKGQPKVHKLLDTKDNDYFYAPLKKSSKTGVGSTFSMFDRATL